MNAVAKKAETSAKSKAPKKAAKKPAAKKGDVVANAKLYDVIRRPLMTEKAYAAQTQNKVTFAIAPKATKKDVKDAVEALFSVEVVKVNTVNTEGKMKSFRGRPGQRNDVRKAIVTLAAGQSIDIAAGLR